jgi:alpha-methylacyl-CoA racemase
VTLGPLHDVRVIEFAGIGPAPFCAMLLRDMGCEVLRIDRPGKPTQNLISRGRSSLSLDLKEPQSVETCLRIIEKADVLIEGFRPGVMERLGLGPSVATERNPRLIYGRMTGWGQDGPLAQAAGHDINYIALSGALAAIGTPAEPLPPLNLVGDYGGGALYLAFGVLAALHERVRSGKGQVVDAAIVDGAASLMTAFCDMKAAGYGSLKRDENMLGGSAPFYSTYRCADGNFIAIGSIEPQFYALLHEKLDLASDALGRQMDPRDWAGGRTVLARIFAQRSRAEWCAMLEGTDVCFAPVLSLEEAMSHPHAKARGMFVEAGGAIRPAPAPRLSRTPGAAPTESARAGVDLLRDWGVN